MSDLEEQWNSTVALLNEPAAKRLGWQVTLDRSLTWEGGEPFVTIEQEVDADAPRTVFYGPPEAAEGFMQALYQALEVDGDSQAREAVREVLTAGADMVSGYDSHGLGDTHAGWVRAQARAGRHRA